MVNWDLKMRNKNINKFTKLICDPQIELISLGRVHSSFKKRNGEIFVFGSNSYGQLGLNSNENQFSKPQLLMKNDQIDSIHCLNGFTLICKNKKQILSCGWNKEGQLGLNHTNQRKRIQNLFSN